MRGIAHRACQTDPRRPAPRIFSRAEACVIEFLRTTAFAHPAIRNLQVRKHLYSRHIAAYVSDGTVVDSEVYLFVRIISVAASRKPSQGLRKTSVIPDGGDVDSSKKLCGQTPQIR